VTKISKDHFILDQATARSIVGISKDLLPINFLVEGAKVQQAIAKVLVEYINEKGEKKGPEPGTGFMISHDLLMTNHHVIPHATPDAPAIHHRINEKIIKVSVCNAKFNYQKDWKNNELPIVDRKCDLSTMISNEQLDYTIIKVDNSPGRELAFVKLDYKIDVKEGEQVCIIQHPGGRHKEISWSNKNRIQSDGTKKDNLPASIILYDADTEGGSSGSPVFNMAWDLIALHHRDRKEVDKNEGIRIKDIINDLLKNFPQMHPNMKSYIQAALIDANLPSDIKSILNIENLVKPGFFESVGLNTEEQISGLKKILLSQRSTDFIDLASWNTGWLRSEKEFNYLIDYVRTADYIHSMAIDVWILYDVSD
jgi:endonuclease G